MKRTDKFLNLGASHRSVPFLGLEVHNVEPETVFADYTIDPLVARLADRLAGVLSGSAVTHLQEELHYQTFKELGRRCFDSVDEFRREASFHLDVCRLQRFLGGLGLRFTGR